MHKFFVFLLAATMLAGASAQAQDDAAQSAPAEVRQALERIIPDAAPDAIRPAEIDGFYEVSYGAEILYISADGSFLMQGELVDLRTQTNLTEQRRAAVRRGIVASLDPEQMIIFAPNDRKTRHVVHVFTDVDCTYCRRLHQEIRDYNDRGIEIRYLAYPRSGPDTPSYYKTVSVWCSEDQSDALTRAKAGERIPSRRCDNPVRQHLALANDFGVRGTPTLVLADGTTLPGYVPPASLADYLDNQPGN